MYKTLSLVLRNAKIKRNFIKSVSANFMKGKLNSFCLYANSRKSFTTGDRKFEKVSEIGSSDSVRHN